MPMWYRTVGELLVFTMGTLCVSISHWVFRYTALNTHSFLITLVFYDFETFHVPLVLGWDIMLMSHHWWLILVHRVVVTRLIVYLAKHQNRMSVCYLLNYLVDIFYPKFGFEKYIPKLFPEYIPSVINIESFSYFELTLKISIRCKQLIRQNSN